MSADRYPVRKLRWAPSRLSILSIASVLFLCALLLLSPQTYNHLSAYRDAGVTRPVWLIATSSAASAQRRRNIIRATLQSAYADPAYEFQFVLADPGDMWWPIVTEEQHTYHDLVILKHLEENAHVANTIKFVEFLKHALDSGHPWRFVSKMDDDSFVAVPAFYRQYLSPLLASDSTEHTLIGRRLQGDREFPYPGGQFYTLSRKTAAAIVKQYGKKPIVDEDEDVLIGRLLWEAGESFDIITLDNPVAFDYDAENQDVWAWSHNVTEDAINPHKMKDDEVYLEVAAQMLAIHPA